ARTMQASARYVGERGFIGHTMKHRMRIRKIMTVLGTRPDAIKLAPVIKELETRSAFRTVNVSSGQHDELLRPLISFFGLRIDRDLNAHRPNQLPGDVCDAITRRALAVLDSESPDLVLVQGDTS